jgi:hypothetical protein
MVSHPKFLILFLVLFLGFSQSGFAEGSPSPTPAAGLPSAVTQASTTLPPAPLLSIPMGTPPGPGVAVPQAAAPPVWAEQLIVAAEKLPLVGPYVAKALLYLGILSSILTVLVAAILTVLNTLMGSFNLAGLTQAAAWLSKFKDGKVMYWLKFFSVFNAKKPTTT